MNALLGQEAKSNVLFLNAFCAQVRTVDAADRAGQDRGDLSGAGFRCH